MKKAIAPLLLFLVVIAIATIAFFSIKKQQTIEAKNAEATAALEAPVPISKITGLIGSEKKEFFEDIEVQRILRDTYHLSVALETVGSRRIATDGGANGTLDHYDFAFPAGVPAAQSIKEAYDVQASYRVFFTPMTVASFKPVVEVLEANGMVRKEAGYYSILDMQKLLELMQLKTRWKDLPNNTEFNIGRQILINTTDIRSSNSAAMYLSLASYLSNDNSIVNSQEQAQTVLPKVLPLFTDQGFLAGSSATPFNDYLSKGMGNSPMVMIYESQYLSQAAQKNGVISDDMMLLYPKPTIFTQHILLAVTPLGKQLGDALTNDEALQKLAITYGYRSNNPSLNTDFAQNLQDHDINNVPIQITEVIETPSYEILEEMIVVIENRLAQ